MLKCIHTHTYIHTHIDANSARWLTGLYSYVANLVAISHCFSFVVVAFCLPLFVAFSCDFIFCSLSVFCTPFYHSPHTHTHLRAHCHIALHKSTFWPATFGGSCKMLHCKDLCADACNRICLCMHVSKIKIAALSRNVTAMSNKAHHSCDTNNKRANVLLSDFFHSIALFVRFLSALTHIFWENRRTLKIQ